MNRDGINRVLRAATQQAALHLREHKGPMRECKPCLAAFVVLLDCPQEGATHDQVPG